MASRSGIGRSPSLHEVRRALAAAGVSLVMGGAANAHAAVDKPPSLIERVTAVRQAISSLAGHERSGSAQSERRESLQRLAQWGNWGNWHNWNNWFNSR